LNLSTKSKTFEVGKTDGLDIEILTGEKILQFYCNDAIDPYRLKPKKLMGRSGQAIISISKIDESKPKWNRSYTATVVLKNIRFLEEDGADPGVTIEELIFENVRVGWLPG
jgi:hypothetical protein